MKRIVRGFACFLIITWMLGLATIDVSAAGKTQVLDAKQVGEGSVVKIRWKRKGVVSKYSIYRSTRKTGKYDKIKTVTCNKRKGTYKDKTVTMGKTYYYKIKGKGLKISKPIKVKVKKTLVSELTSNVADPETPVMTYPVLSIEPSVAPNTQNPGEATKKPTMITPTPIPTITVSLDSLGTEGEDYYVVSPGYTTQGFDSIARIQSNVITLMTSGTVVLKGSLEDIQVQCGVDNIEVTIALLDTSITNTDYSFINNEKASSITIATLEDTTNELIMGEGYSSDCEIGRASCRERVSSPV